MEIVKLTSQRDGLALELAVFFPEAAPKGIVQFSHGMAEHKERYYPVMEYLAAAGYAAVIHDHRGHGASVRDESDLGYFYTDRPEDISEDLFQVCQYAKERFPGLPLFLFSHSMGTLVARVFLQTHDDAVKKVILCGPPTENPLAGLGIFLVSINALFLGRHHRSPFINRLALGAYAIPGEGQNAWICADPHTVRIYNADPLCGFTFTNNGFLNLFRLVKQSFDPAAWHPTNPRLPILLMAGAHDPVIQGHKKFDRLAAFLRAVGYENVSARLYPDMRHEIFSEVNKQVVWQDILAFIQGELLP